MPKDRIEGPCASGGKSKLLSALLKALRNLLVSAADLAWGHVNGVVVPRKIVSTGLGLLPSGKGTADAGDLGGVLTSALEVPYEVRLSEPGEGSPSRLSI